VDPVGDIASDPFIAIIPIAVRQILACALQNLKQKLAVGHRDRLRADALRQVQVGEVQTALILDQRELMILLMDHPMEVAVLPAANRRRAALNAVGLDVLAALGVVCFLQILELLDAI